MGSLAPSRRRLIAAVAALVLLALVVGRHLASAPSAAPAARAPEVLGAKQGGGGGAKIVVHVVGAVRRPGLYSLPHSARVADAVRRAGGTTKKANLEAINLAAELEDGLQVVVPRVVAPSGAGDPAAAGDPSAAGGPVHLNTATLEQLDALPGVGPVTAQKILDWRQEHGAFTSLDDLDAIPGIGPARIEQLRDVAAP
jgi:competence protein ComEA